MYLETAKQEKRMKDKKGCRLNVSGVLRYLGISRSGYASWKERIPSSKEQKKNDIKNKIRDINDASHQIYGAPKIREQLINIGKKISEKTVGNYMREMGLKAQWVKHYTVRIRSHCDYKSPNDYERSYWIKLRKIEIQAALLN